MKKQSLSHVFGVSRDFPLTYVERKYVDTKFQNNLARDKHIVVYGGSKQGKTCLRKHSLQPEDYIVVQCGNTTDAHQLYSIILKEAGATTKVTEQKTTRGTFKLGVEFSAKGKIPLLAEGKGEAKGSGEGQMEVSSKNQYLEIDPADPNDVIRVLDSMGFQKFIVLEDFHYLSEDVQKEIAIDLKAFHEKSKLCFIIIGVWLESNRLVLYNGDLAGRLIPIDADKWKEADLRRVIETGESILNIVFPVPVKDEILLAAEENVGILQETCYRLCQDTGVHMTQDAPTEVGSVENVGKIVNEIAAEQAGRYQNFLTQFAEGFQKTKLDMYRLLAYVLITATPPELRAGLKMSKILERLRDKPLKCDHLQFANVLQTLKNVGKLQHKHRVQPIILDFDSNDNVLRVVDSAFILYTESVEEKQLIELIGMDPENMKDFHPLPKA